MTQNLFLFLSFLAIFSSLMVVFSRNPIHSVLYLILTFFAIAGHYVLMNAQFLAVVHIIVYAGAIMVLFLFTIMLLNLSAETEPHKPNILKAIGVVAAGLLLVTIVGALKAIDTPAISGNLPQSREEIGLVKTLGRVLFTDFVIPFELSSLLFIAAMVGAVLLGRKETTEGPQQASL